MSIKNIIVRNNHTGHVAKDRQLDCNVRSTVVASELRGTEMTARGDLSGVVKNLSTYLEKQEEPVVGTSSSCFCCQT